MTDKPDIFEIQRLGPDGTWQLWTNVGSGGDLSHRRALAYREQHAAEEPGARFRVVPFGYGPRVTEPSGVDPMVQLEAYKRLKAQVLYRGGNPDDIYLWGDGFRWRCPPDDPHSPGVDLGWHWASGRLTEAGFTESPQVADVTAGGGC